MLFHRCYLSIQGYFWSYSDSSPIEINKMVLQKEMILACIHYSLNNILTLKVPFHISYLNILGYFYSYCNTNFVKIKLKYQLNRATTHTYFFIKDQSVKLDHFIDVNNFYFVTKWSSLQKNECLKLCLKDKSAVSIPIIVFCCESQVFCLCRWLLVSFIGKKLGCGSKRYYRY